MTWLLHSRRVPLLPNSRRPRFESVGQALGSAEQPATASGYSSESDDDCWSRKGAIKLVWPSGRLVDEFVVKGRIDDFIQKLVEGVLDFKGVPKVRRVKSRYLETYEFLLTLGS